MSGSHSSAGVYVREIDLSQRVERATSSIGVIVGEAHRGPVGQRTLVTSEKDFVNLFGEPDPTIGFGIHSAIAFLEEADRLYYTRVAPEALYGGAVITWDGYFNQSSSFLQGESDPTLHAMTANDLFVVYPKDPGSWNDTVFIRLYPDTRTTQAYFYLEVYLKDVAVPVEKWRCHLNFVVDGNGVQANVEEQVNRRSNYIRISQNHQATELVTNPNKVLINRLDAGGDPQYIGIRMPGGSDGRRPNIGELMQAWDLYADPEVVDINILINAGYTDTNYQSYMNSLAKDRMDCVCILDTPSDMQEFQQAISFRRNDLHLDSSYAALYSPDVYTVDKYNDTRLYLPPSGFVAAAYARTDRDYELWFAPAGMNRGDLKVSGLGKTYDQGMRDALYESQVNAIKIIEGQGIKIWGADTLQVVASSLSNISVRRLMIFIEKSLSNSLIAAVFDPNDEILRARLTDQAVRFLNPIKQARGLYNFEVICNESNNPAESIAAGDLNIDIYIDPVLPVKRIHFTAIINRTGVRVTAGNI